MSSRTLPLEPNQFRKQRQIPAASMGVTPAVSAQFQAHSTDQVCRASECSSSGCPGKPSLDNQSCYTPTLDKIDLGWEQDCSSPGTDTKNIFAQAGNAGMLVRFHTLLHQDRTVKLFLVLIMTNPVGYLVPIFEPFLFCLVVYRTCKGHTMDGFLSYQDGWRGLYVV